MVINKKKNKQLVFSLFIIYLLCIAIYNPEIFGFNFSNYILFFTVAIALIYFNPKIHVRKNLFVVLLMLYTIFLFAALQLSNTDSITRLIKLMIPLLVMLICSRIIDSKQSINNLTSIISYANVAACLFGIISYYILRDRGYTMLQFGIRIGRMRGSFLQPNVFASFLTITIPFPIYYCWQKTQQEKKFRFLLAFVVALNIFCIYMARSRWGMITFVIMIALYPLFLYTYRSKKSIIIGLLTTLIIVIILIFILYFNSYAINLFASRQSNNVRLGSYQQAYELAKSNHFFGLGLGYGIGRVLDSSILNVLIDTGLIGLLVFVYLCSVCLVHLIKKRNHNNDFALVPYCMMFICFCVQMIAESVLYNSLVNCFLGIILFLCIYKPNSSTTERKISQEVYLEGR